MTGTAPDRQQRVERLTAAARARTQRAQQHAEKIIRRMLRDQLPITFRAVHRESDCPWTFSTATTPYDPGSSMPAVPRAGGSSPHRAL
jgi:hypothetical protein